MLHKDFRDFLALLARHKVRYLVVGGQRAQEDAAGTVRRLDKLSAGKLLLQFDDQNNVSQYLSIINSYIVKRWISNGESDVLEFKKSFNRDAVETLCAFANHRGGIVLIGVDDAGKIVGTSCGGESMQSWVNEIKQNTMPPIIPDIETTIVNGKSVVMIRVDEFPVKPVAHRDRYFKRVASSNHRLSLTEIANVHMQSLQLSWDSYLDMKAALKDLSSDKVDVFLKRVKEGGRFQEEGDWRVTTEDDERIGKCGVVVSFS